MRLYTRYHVCRLAQTWSESKNQICIILCTYMIIDLRILIRFNNIIILLHYFLRRWLICSQIYNVNYFVIILHPLLNPLFVLGASFLIVITNTTKTNKKDQVLIGDRSFSYLRVHDFPWFVYLVNDNDRVTYECLFCHHRETSAKLYNSRYIEFSRNKSSVYTLNRVFHQTCTMLPIYNLIYNLFKYRFLNFLGNLYLRIIFLIGLEFLNSLRTVL